MPAVTQGPLKEFLKTRRSTTLIVGAVDKYLQTRVPDTSRRTDVLHPSEIVGKDWCLRASYHLLRGAEPKRVSHPLRVENIFRTGHDIHHKWQGWLSDVGLMLGTYECQWCGHPTKSLGWPEGRCGWCEVENFGWKYQEEKLSIPDLRTEGHTDGGLVLGDLDVPVDEIVPDHLLEIKSIGTGTIRTYAPALLRESSLEEAFKKINLPFPGHNRQVQVYLEAARLKYGEKAPTKAVILYECKANQAVKEFVVDRNRALIEDVLDKAYEVVQAVKAEEEPECSIHPGEDCPKCKEFAE